MGDYNLEDPRARTRSLDRAVVKGREGKRGIAQEITTKSLADYVIKRVEQLAKAQNASQEPQYFKGRDAAVVAPQQFVQGRKVNWRYSKKLEYDNSIRRVLEGIEFDIDHNKFWMDRWGKRPPTLSAAFDIARKEFET